MAYAHVFTAQKGAAATDAADTTGVDLFYVGGGNYTGTSISLGDSKSNAWTTLTERTQGGAVYSHFWSRPSSVGSGHIFTLSGATAPAIIVLGFSGSHATPFDAQAGDSDASSPANPFSAGSVDPAEIDELLVAGICYYPDGTLSASESMTIVNQHYVESVSMGLSLAYKVLSSGAAVTPAFTTSSFYNEVGTGVACFKAAGEAAAGQPTMRRWGGVPHVGGQGIGSKGPGRMWGRTRSGLIVPRRFQEAA